MAKWFKNKHALRNFLLFTGGILAIIASFIVIWIASFKIPDFGNFDDRKVVNSTKIYDRTGKVLLYDVHQDVKRTSIPFDQMSLNIKNATVAVEDSDFYNHKGIRLTSIIRATIVAKLTGKRITGGSTITQQLVKNTLLTQERSITRKVKEWVLAIKIESSMPKDKILELYLNEVPYGGTVYGIEQASKTYFNKSASDLTLAESAYLASIPQAPTTLSPYGKNKERLEERKNYVLSRMLELKFISQEEYDNAKSEVVVFEPQQVGGIKAPHFVFFVRDYLEKKYGADVVRQGGLKVITTLDYSLQEKAEKFVKDGALANQKDWGGENAALVAIDPKTGEILSMVGSRDYFDKEIDGNFNVATALRQPGSSFKPFIYATAFNKGFTPETVLFDLPTEFQTTCGPDGKALPGKKQSDCYMPDNYDGNFRGPMSLRDALAQSINVPAVKLFYLAGLTDSLKTAEDMGVSTLNNIDQYGLTLVIGGGEVTLLDMTSAYGVFANNGQRSPYGGVLKVEDMNGVVLEEFTARNYEVLPKNTSLIISDILSDNQARTPTFGANSQLLIGGKDVAVKTGTTNSNRDAWIIGYTPSIVVGVWAGNNDNRPMKKGGAAMAGPIWNKFMNEVLKTIPNEKFEEPNLYTDKEKVKPVLRGYWQGNNNFFIDKFSRKLATELTPKEALEERVVTDVHSILYWIDRNNILGPAPTSPYSNPQFERWDYAIQKWWNTNKQNYPLTTWSDKPSDYDDVHIGINQPFVNILEPSFDKIYQPDQKINLKISSLGKFPLTKIDIFINDVYLFTTNPPFNFSFTPKDLEVLRGENTIKLIVQDSVLNKAEIESIFKVAQ